MFQPWVAQTIVHLKFINRTCSINACLTTLLLQDMSLLHSATTSSWQTRPSFLTSESPQRSPHHTHHTMRPHLKTIPNNSKPLRCPLPHQEVPWIDLLANKSAPPPLSAASVYCVRRNASIGDPHVKSCTSAASITALTFSVWMSRAPLISERGAGPRRSWRRMRLCCDAEALRRNPPQRPEKDQAVKYAFMNYLLHRDGAVLHNMPDFELRRPAKVTLDSSMLYSCS